MTHRRTAPAMWLEPSGDNPALADELAASGAGGREDRHLLRAVGFGRRRATRSRSPVRCGSCSTGAWGAAPLCITETVEVTFRRYDEVDAAFAYDEGEGDRSLEYWRGAHRRFFSWTLPAIGKEFTPEMPLVCERFRVVYREAEIERG